ncbi:hypothetical protein BCR41DRAFT_356746 [Lobosporangium transversale]|uniref:Phospholipase n=1 Tax=Lobosporangium transversale TaxID=64571 RepID=A0A1Y2GIE8_9FUNG|nr:hypothetical protein BCR41DRAFT_356746 [Lobosporangium transversale]ORZ11679.1 hypothetical protein BCR41DRAFT_356746 [Lobosporangium transversale]|eukprot:XP_021879776.1 hypothetical protein BCR41DRAFT_356746 [Lobosporangium transversale]
MSHYSQSSDSTRPLNLSALLAEEQQRQHMKQTIEFTVESLAVTGAAAPAFLFQKDEKGRSHLLGIVDSESDPGAGIHMIFRVEFNMEISNGYPSNTLRLYKLHLTLTAKRYRNIPDSLTGSMGVVVFKDTAVRETNLARRNYKLPLAVMQALNGTFLEISALSLTKDMGWKGKEEFSEYTRSWAILRDSYMAFLPDISSDDHKEQVLGLNLHHIEIGNMHRKVEMKGGYNREMIEWVDHIKKMEQASPWVKNHRFDSFAPEREDAKIRYYVDGKDYFHAVSDAILAAKNEIYIADWWLSPELYLRRPPEKNEEFRKVKIYVVVYKEISLALTLDSAHTKTWLQDLHRNIQVQRHPDHIGVNATQFWAHHEKICVIDCRLAFIGGLDLLSDYHPSGSGTIWPGQDYSNPRIKDFVNVKEYHSDLIERKLLSRMPWHDVSIGRWNFVKREKGMKKTHMKFLTPKGEFVSTRNESGWTGTQKVQILRSSTTWSQGVDLERSIQNAYLSCIENAEHFIYIENQFFVTLAVEDGNPELKNTIGIAIVNRIIRAHSKGEKFRVIVMMPLMPAFEADIMASEAGTLRKVMHFQYMSICRGGNSVLERLEANGINPDQYIGFYGLRSFDRIKHGKFDAILEAVKEAELEGVLLSSGQTGETADSVDTQEKGRVQAGSNEDKQVKAAEGGEVKERKSLASKFLLDPIPRDKRAEQHGFIPAATERTLKDKRELKRPVWSNKNHTPSYTDGSNIDDAKEESEMIIEPAPKESNASQSPENAPLPISNSSSSGSSSKTKDDDDSLIEDNEQLYVHSKLMIIDDRIIIIGSANINDRSQVGYRDSEIAIIIEDTEMVPSKMNGEEYQAGKIAHALRTDLFKEHLGLLPHVEHDVVTQASVLPQGPALVCKELIADSLTEQQEEKVHVPFGHGGFEGIQQWHAKLSDSKVKQDPKTADQIVMDPLHDDFYVNWWKRVANQNTLIFREIFHCVPDQTVETWDEYKAFIPDNKKVLTGHVVMEGATVENVTEKLQGITGHLVEFPTRFLCKENLLGNIVEGAVTPLEIFT